MENQTMQLPELPGPVPQNAETSFDVPQAAAEFRTTPKAAEDFGKIPQAAERKENHTLTVRETARMFETAGWLARNAASSTGASPIVRALRDLIPVSIQTSANITSHRRAWRR